MDTSHSRVMNAISEDTIRPYWLSYFREFNRGRVHEQLLELFDAWKARGNNRASLAKKLDRRPEQVTRWLSSPTNFEIDTVSDIALAMGYLPRLSFDPIDIMERPNNGPVAVAIEAGNGYLAKPATAGTAFLAAASQ